MSFRQKGILSAEGIVWLMYLVQRAVQSMLWNTAYRILQILWEVRVFILR